MATEDTTQTNTQIKKRLKALENEVARLQKLVSSGDSKEKLDGDEKWEQAFNQTTDKQWAKLADDIKDRIENEELLSSDVVFDTEK
jgi:hypothetical protein